MDVESLPLQRLYELIQEYPGLLRRPIILDEKRLRLATMKMKFVVSYLEKFEHINYKKRNEW